VILIMTTNAGAADMAKAAFGFTRSKREGDDMEAIHRLFAPNSATGSTGDHYLRASVAGRDRDGGRENSSCQLEAQLADRDCDDRADRRSRRKWLIANGYDELMGARPDGGG